jgi:fructuronate reductase
MVYVARGTDANGTALTLDDPQADKLRAASANATSPQAVVDALLGIDSIFGTDLRESATFRALLTDHVTALGS